MLNGNLIPISHVVRYLRGYLGQSLNFKEHVKLEGKEANVKTCKNQINQEISIHRGLHHSSFDAVSNPSKLLKCITLQPTREDNRKIPTYSKHLCQAGIKLTLNMQVQQKH